MGFGFMFKLEDSCIGHHAGERAVRGGLEDLEGRDLGDHDDDDNDDDDDDDGPLDEEQPAGSRQQGDDGSEAGKKLINAAVALPANRHPMLDAITP
jgi:hypothetical protein